MDRSGEWSWDFFSALTVELVNKATRMQLFNHFLLFWMVWIGRSWFGFSGSITYVSLLPRTLEPGTLREKVLIEQVLKKDVSREGT